MCGYVCLYAQVTAAEVAPGNFSAEQNCRGTRPHPPACTCAPQISPNNCTLCLQVCTRMSPRTSPRTSPWSLAALMASLASSAARQAICIDSSYYSCKKRCTMCRLSPFSTPHSSPRSPRFLEFRPVVHGGPQVLTAPQTVADPPGAPICDTTDDGERIFVWL